MYIHICVIIKLFACKIAYICCCILCGLCGFIKKLPELESVQPATAFTYTYMNKRFHESRVKWTKHSEAKCFPVTQVIFQSYNQVTSSDYIHDHATTCFLFPAEQKKPKGWMQLDSAYRKSSSSQPYTDYVQIGMILS